jgi:hypothetical protein
VTDQNQLLLRARVQDLLHLLSFAEIVTPTPGDKPEAEKAMADIRRLLAAPAQPQGEAVATVLVQHGYWSRGNFHEGKRWHAVGLPALEHLPDGTKLYAIQQADDSRRSVDARNKLNAAIHGDGAVIDDLETAVHQACLIIKRHRASQQAAQAVPEGWQLVPIEPTAEMISAALRDCGGIGGGSCGEHTGVDGSDFADVWGTMLRAAKGEQ